METLTPKNCFKDIFNSLEDDGFSELANRLIKLYQMGVDEYPDMKRMNFRSLENCVSFLTRYELHIYPKEANILAGMPNVAMGYDGILGCEWNIDGNIFMSINFMDTPKKLVDYTCISTQSTPKKSPYVQGISSHTVAVSILEKFFESIVSVVFKIHFLKPYRNQLV